MKKKRDQWLIGKKIPSIYRKQVTLLQSGNQSYMELRHRTVELRQQVQHSHHAGIQIQNSRSHSKCTLLYNKSHSKYRLNIPYVSDVIIERINKYYNKMEAHPNPLLEPLLQTVNTRRQKRRWPLDSQGT